MYRKSSRHTPYAVTPMQITARGACLLLYIDISDLSLRVCSGIVNPLRVVIFFMVDPPNATRMSPLWGFRKLGG